MITFNQLTPQNFIKRHHTTTPQSEIIQTFQTQLQNFLSQSIRQSDEEYQKNEINRFLNQVFQYIFNTKGRIDSAIYIQDKPQVLIEVKSLSNKSEFPKSPDNPLSKAFYESILYFLRELSEGNNSLKHIILCNPYEFYLFDAKDFLVFADDRHIKKLYKNCDHKEGLNVKTEKFYKDLESYLKTDFSKELSYTSFNLSTITAYQDLAVIYQLLSPQVLLKQKPTIDANTLNKGFYEELLYILGLEERSENGKSTGKILIKTSSTANTLSYAIKEAYPQLNEEEIFTLITTWNNRILFLRLFDSMLDAFNHYSQPQSRFLTPETLPNFAELNILFLKS